MVHLDTDRILNHPGRGFFTTVLQLPGGIRPRSQAASAAFLAQSSPIKPSSFGSYAPSFHPPPLPLSFASKPNTSKRTLSFPGLQILPLLSNVSTYNFSSFHLFPYNTVHAQRQPKHTLFTHFLCIKHSLLLTLISSILHSLCLPLQPLPLLLHPRFPALTAVPPLGHPLLALMVRALPATLVILLKPPAANMMVRISISFQWLLHF
jgi:hypothetical protein